MTKSRTSTRTPNRVLGIDPGFDRVGVAVLERDEVLFSDCIETSRKLPHSARLAQIGKTVRTLIEKWEPGSLAIENLFFNQSVTNAMKVAEARGVIIYEAERAGLTIAEYGPQEVKIAVTGYGKADKKQVEAMIGKLVKMTEHNGKRLDDELDAIALGITHLATKKGI